MVNERPLAVVKMALLVVNVCALIAVHVWFDAYASVMREQVMWYARMCRDRAVLTAAVSAVARERTWRETYAAFATRFVRVCMFAICFQISLASQRLFLNCVAMRYCVEINPDEILKLLFWSVLPAFFWPFLFMNVGVLLDV
jgi:hypothetical protein